MNIKNSLEELGLSQNEITIYLYLLSKGESLGSQIYKENLIDKSAAYKAIAQLERRGLVVSLGESRNKLYKVTEKETIVELFEKKKQEIDQSKSSFLSAFSDIEKYSAEHYQNENVKIFVGDDAIERYHYELIRGDVSVIREIAASETAHLVAGDKKNLDKTMKWFIKERVSKKIAIRVMYDANAVPDEYDVSNESLYKECRRFAGTLTLTSMLTVFGDRVGFTTLKNGKYWALVIQDPLISALLASVYDSLWNQSNKV
jgi:sugar-specific transcriptional regulator TrmB